MEGPIYLQDFTGKFVDHFARLVMNDYMSNRSSTSMLETAFSTTNLESMERLDRASPELWPEQVPGIQEFVPRTIKKQKKPEWMGSFNNDDVKLLLGLSKMSPPVLIQEVKKLYDAAYQLGMDESREMTRGMFLKVLQSKESNSNETRPNGT